MNAILEEVEKILKDNNLYYDADIMPDLPVISISVEWGDWKHEHLALEQIMNKNGFSHIGHLVTDEDGSDCYSADHYFIKSSK